MGGPRHHNGDYHPIARKCARNQWVVTGCRRGCDSLHETQLSFFLHFSFSLPDALSLSTTLPIAAPPLCTLFPQQILPFFFIFFTLFTLSTSIFDYFSFFLPHSPNFTTPNPNPHFSLSKNPATSRCFPTILPPDFISPHFNLHFALLFATIPHHFLSHQNVTSIKA